MWLAHLRLVRAGCFNRLGELRDRTFAAQRYRANSVNLVVAAIILWNTVYLDRAIASLSEAGRPFDAAWLPHLAPVHWDHIYLTGDYSWRQNRRVEKGGFRPMRPTRKSQRTLYSVSPNDPYLADYLNRAFSCVGPQPPGHS